MSLIPSESLSFPDSFRATIGWRLAKGPSPEHSHPELEAITAAPRKEHAASAERSASTVNRREHVVLRQTRHEEVLSAETAMRETEPTQLQVGAPLGSEAVQQTEHSAAAAEVASATRESAHVVSLQTGGEQALSEETSVREETEPQLQFFAQPEPDVVRETERSAPGEESASTTREREGIVLPPILREEGLTQSTESQTNKSLMPADKAEPIRPQPVAVASGYEAVPKTEAKIPARIRIVPRKNVARISTEPGTIPLAPRPKFRSLARTENSDPVNMTNKVKESMAPGVPPRKESTAGDESQAIGTPPQSPAVKMPARPGPFHAQIDLFPESERRGRWIRFIAGEIVALAALIVLLRIAWTQRFADRAIVALLLITIGGAVAAVVTLPIIFARNNPARWVRD